MRAMTSRSTVTRLLRTVFPVLLVSSVAAATTVGLEAQVIPPGVDLDQVARSMSQEEIVRRLEASGLTRAQVSDRLRRAGYDPRMADRYFDAIESGESLTADPSDALFLDALRGIGVTLRADGLEASGRPPAVIGERPSVDSPRLLVPEEDTVPGVFGRDVFRRVSSQFEPALTGAVGAGYPLGPGDELLLVLTGDVERAYTLDVTREGFVVIPDVGQISVNGLTLGDLEDRLFDRLGRVYSGVRRSADATTRFDVSLGRLRTNQVRVVGSVFRPGSYQVSSVATVLEALYQAGGPTDLGSFRRVTLQRRGRDPVSIDLYPYLTQGALEAETRLEEGDVVFVPPVGAQVTVRGMVRRRAVFELLDGEGLPALLRFAGGLLPDARTDRVQVDRILPPADRAGGVDRVLLDAPLESVLAGAADFPLRGGDEVQVFEILDRVRQRVRVTGGVWRPGQYELRPGTTVGSLIQRAGGLVDDALANDILVLRLDLTTGERSAFRVALTASNPGPLLEEFDEVAVFARDPLTVPDSVAVYGLVQQPGRYPLARGMTAGDLVLLAGGFAPGALPWSAEVVRRERNGDRQRLSSSTTVALRAGLPYPDIERAGLRPDSMDALAPEDEVPLEDGDEVYVRLIPGYVTAKRVTVEGEVVSPGPYQLNRQNERFSSLIRRAGGLTDAAFAEGIRLLRDGVPVGVQYRAAVERPGSQDDPVLAGGDRILVPLLDNTVLIGGAVLFESRAVYREGLSLDDFVEQAGGYAQDADRNRVSVEYANGSRATASRVLWLFRRTPRIEPGASIFVPVDEASGGAFDWDSALSRVLAVATTLATVYLATSN